MKSKFAGIIVALLWSSTILAAPKDKTFEVKSPNSGIILKIEIGEKLQWSVTHKGQQIIKPSAISMELENEEFLGDNIKILSSDIKSINTEFKAINYRKTIVKDQYNTLILNCQNDFGVEFRTYDDAIAYRFFTKKKGDIVVKNEEANFNFSADHQAFIPYLWDYRGGHIFNASFESLYTVQMLSQFAKDSLAILPTLVDVGSNKKVVILEADLEDYPGMFLNQNQTGIGFKGVYAPYPLEAKIGGHSDYNQIPVKRADYIAKTKGTRTFPWRAIAISEQDKDLLNNDLVQKLASPSRIDDISWIIPGQVAWDWWDGYNISHVNFKAGMNTETFLYYIDFASANKAKYIILDEGWSARFDMKKINSNVNLEKIINYGKEKGVGVILWASWANVFRQMKDVFPKYAQMGVKGWKIDFIDRDDQLAVASTYEIAKLAAQYHFLVDYHGVFKPTGLQRTYPNVVGYEGVYGLENFKWADMDAPGYAVTIPFIRNIAGPVDYTSGAMRNATQADFVARNHAPMSKGTRCNQLAQYVVFEVPIQMLSDSPTTYMKEQECTDFITSIPTIFDETIPLDGKLGEYVAIARKKGDDWFVGAMTNWSAREIIIDLSFLPAGKYQAEIFSDGINSDKEATDYKKEVFPVSSEDKLQVRMYPGGGWAACISPLNNRK